MRPEQGEQRAPTLLYYYPHRYLRDVVFDQTDKFRSLCNRGPQATEAALRRTFAELQNDPENALRGKDIALDDNDFSTSLSHLEGDVPLLLIKFPQPEQAPEVFYVGVTMQGDPRYFTLELQKPMLFKKGPKVYRYRIGEWTREGHHSLFHDLIEPRPGYFAGAVNNLLKLKRE